MDIKDQLFYLKNRLFEKRNIVLIIVLTIIFLIIFTCLTTIQFSVENKREALNSEIGRTYLVDYKDGDQLLLEKLKEINHIELIKNSKYYSGNYFIVSDFFEYGEGEVYIKALVSQDDVRIKHGKNVEDKYDLICSNTFYPFSLEEGINSSLFLSSKDILNKKIKINSNNEDLNKKEITLNIVGTYKNKFMEESNTCYTNIETYDEIASKYNGYGESYDEEGNLIERTYSEYDGYFIRIDDKKNIEEVLTKLSNMEIWHSAAFILDEGFLAILYFIPLFIGIIVIILTIAILYSFINKKINNRIHSIGILKAIGYNNETIIKLNINENIIVIIVSGIIAFVPYLIVLNYLKFTILAEVTYCNYILNIPIALIILPLVLFCFIITRTIKSKFKSLFNQSIQTLLEK